jgi:hypothetical protein
MSERSVGWPRLTSGCQDRARHQGWSAGSSLISVVRRGHPRWRSTGSNLVTEADRPADGLRTSRQTSWRAPARHPGRLGEARIDAVCSQRVRQTISSSTDLPRDGSMQINHPLMSATSLPPPAHPADTWPSVEYPARCNTMSSQYLLAHGDARSRTERREHHFLSAGSPSLSHCLVPLPGVFLQFPSHLAASRSGRSRHVFAPRHGGSPLNARYSTPLGRAR